MKKTQSSTAAFSIESASVSALGELNPTQKTVPIEQTQQIQASNPTQQVEPDWNKVKAEFPFNDLIEEFCGKNSSGGPIGQPLFAGLGTVEYEYAVEGKKRAKIEGVSDDNTKYTVTLKEGNEVKYVLSATVHPLAGGGYTFVYKKEDIVKPDDGMISN